MEVRYPQVRVALIGQPANVFAIVSQVTRALERAGHRAGAKEYCDAVEDCDSYDAVLQLTLRTVEVE